MKTNLNTVILKYVTFSAGMLGLVLRLALYATGFDGRNLLIPGHWANVGLCVLTAITIPVLFILSRGLADSDTPVEECPASPIAALGASLAGCAILYTGIREFSSWTRIDLITSVLAVAAGVSLLILAVFRFRGDKPMPLLHGLVSLFFAIRMVQRYRFWSADPQLQDYCFCLGAYVAMMLAAYHHAASDAGMTSRKALWFYSLTGVFLCCLSVKSLADTWLLLCCALWVFTNMPRPIPPQRRVTEPAAEIQN